MKLKSMMKRLVNLLAAFILSVNCISAQNLTRWVIRLLEPVLFNLVFLGIIIRELLFLLVWCS